MVDRVLLDISGLKVSAAGYDVKSANAAGLIFDSNWSNLKHHASGQILIPFQSPNHRVNFGRTFPTPPLVFMCTKQGDQYLPTGWTFNNNFYMAGYNGSLLQFVTYITTDTSGISFSCLNASGVTKVIAYSIWDYTI